MKQSRRFDILIWVLALVPLAAAALPLQNIPNHDGGIYPVQQRQSLICIQPHISNAGHSAKSKIGVQQFLRFVDFPIRIVNPFAQSSGGTFALPDGIAMKVQEFPEGKGKHLDFHAAPGQIGGIL